MKIPTTSGTPEVPAAVTDAVYQAAHSTPGVSMVSASSTPRRAIDSRLEATPDASRVRVDVDPDEGARVDLSIAITPQAAARDVAADVSEAVTRAWAEAAADQEGVPHLAGVGVHVVSVVAPSPVAPAPSPVASASSPMAPA